MIESRYDFWCRQILRTTASDILTEWGKDRKMLEEELISSNKLLKEAQEKLEPHGGSEFVLSLIILKHLE